MQTVIKFTKNIGPYSPGDSAGFDDVQANAYIDGGFAELVSRPAPKKEAGPVITPAASVEGEQKETAPAAATESAASVQYGRKGRK